MFCRCESVKMFSVKGVVVCVCVSVMMGYYYYNHNCIDYDVLDKIELKYEENMSVILMGDSVLDNFYWLKDKRLDITQQLKNTYKKYKMENVNIINLAVDETESINLINNNGIKPKQKYIEKRKELGMESYPIDNSTGKVFPFKLLQKIIDKEEDDQHSSEIFVIVSIGGNDVRILLQLKNVSKIIAALQKRNFEENIQQIIETLKTMEANSSNNIHINVIPIMCYSPKYIVSAYLGFEENDFEFLMNWGYNLFLKVAKKYNLSVIDLYSSFDKYDSSYYSSLSPIEPSNKSGQIITNLIIYAINDHLSMNKNKKKKKEIYYIDPDQANTVKTKQNSLFQFMPFD